MLEVRIMQVGFLEVVGSYNPKKRVFEEQDLFRRVEGRKIYHLPGPLYNYVKHGRSLTDRRRRIIR